MNSWSDCVCGGRVNFDSVKKKYKLHDIVSPFLVKEGAVQAAGRKKDIGGLTFWWTLHTVTPICQVSVPTRALVLQLWWVYPTASQRGRDIWVVFIKVGRPAHCGWHQSPGWTPGLCKGEGAEQQPCIHCSPPDCRCSISSCFKLLLLWFPHHNVPWTGGWNKPFLPGMVLSPAAGNLRGCLLTFSAFALVGAGGLLAHSGWMNLIVKGRHTRG